MSAEPIELPATDTVVSESSVRAAGRRAVATDLAAASGRRRLALVGVLVWLAYEWGPGNESVTPWLLAHVIGTTDGIAVIPLTAVVGFVFTTVQQLASGFTALAGFSAFERTASVSWDRLRRGSAVAPGEWSTLGRTRRCAMVFGLGTTAVALVQIMTTGETGVRRHASVVRSSAMLCGALVAVLGGSAAALAEVGRNVSALRGGTDWVLRVLGNPLFWLTVLVLPIVIRAVARRFSDH